MNILGSVLQNTTSLSTKRSSLKSVLLQLFHVSLIDHENALWNVGTTKYYMDIYGRTSTSIDICVNINEGFYRVYGNEISV